MAEYVVRAASPGISLFNPNVSDEEENNNLTPNQTPIQTNISGAMASSLVLSNVQSAQAGNYSVRVSNTFGTVTSSNAVLTVNPGGSNALVKLINVDIGAGSATLKSGPAAVVSALCIASLAFVKAVYPQYLLLWMPFLAALAARQIVRLVERIGTRRAALAVILTGEGLVLIQFDLWRRAFSEAAAGALPRLTEVGPSNAVVLLALGVALIAVVVAARREKWDVAAVLLAGLGMGYGVLRNFDTALWSNRDQLAAIEAVNRQVPPDGRILDGFTGYGALRPHAWYYWWINRYSLALITEQDLNEGLLALLNKSQPAAVLFDRNLASLPQPVVDWIHTHYEAADPPVLWLPRHPEM
jgi:hypothetical protein